MIHNQIDQLLSEKIQSNRPGAVVAVVKDGEVIHRKAYGLANVEWHIPNTPETVFRIASLTKQFTAVAIMMLVEQGKISLADSITKFFPNFSTSGHHVTVTHLLNHTSGIQSLTSLPDFMDFVRDNLTPQDAYQKFAHLPFDFAPGAEFRYNNSGYHLLGMIIEQVSGQSYEDFVKQNIFDPLEMNTARYLHNHTVVPHRAHGYNESEDGVITNAMFLDMSIPYAAGSLGASVDDLVKWDRALRQNTLISAESLKLMHRPTRLNDGSESSYGFGWGVHTYHSYPIVEHSGGIFGFSTFMVHLFEHGVTVIVLCNTTGLNATVLAFACLRRVMNIPEPVYAEVQLTPEQLLCVEGDFQLERSTPGVGDNLSLTIVNGQVRSPQLPNALIPFSETGFYQAENLEWVMIFDEGYATGVVKSPYGETVFERVNKPAETVV